MSTLTKDQRRAKRVAGDRDAMERGSRCLPNGNDGPCVMEFAGRGVPLDQIDTFGPNQNVRTYRAWRAKGRQVRKGEKSVRLTVWRPHDDNPGLYVEPGADGKPVRVKCRPVTACVFHISQTDLVNGKAVV